MLTDALISSADVFAARAMALALDSDLRTMSGEVARGHGYDHLKEEQLSAIEKFVFEQDANRVWKISYLRTSTHNIRSSEGTYSTHIDCTDCESIATHTQRCTYVLDCKRCVGPTTCYNINSSHLTITQLAV